MTDIQAMRLVAQNYSFNEMLDILIPENPDYENVPQEMLTESPANWIFWTNEAIQNGNFEWLWEDRQW